VNQQGAKYANKEQQGSTGRSTSRSTSGPTGKPKKQQISTRSKNDQQVYIQQVDQPVNQKGAKVKHTNKE
jgi:hypothetical protein